ncbi:hypothetical protein [Paenibacillus xerothermodurans]|uniref:YncE family protein n=1 Tax=Paenibacillus xerothermodurans TaxID=1977292 RepID=A0A2W1NRC0_PAEXE|nr:hypothetical protein [Paenibacillus xerothermodurans]PZE20286.1 hypothetical protein CBW46_014145 [Paenibacillus xerothermodurans]
MEKVDCRTVGCMPTGRYPAGIELSQNGRKLFVANSEGSGPGPNPDGAKRVIGSLTRPAHSGSMLPGSLSIIDVPDNKQLERYTKMVSKNNAARRGIKSPSVDGSRQAPCHVVEASKITCMQLRKGKRTF